MKFKLLIPLGIIVVLTLLLLTISSRETARSEFHRFKALEELQHQSINISEELKQLSSKLQHYFKQQKTWSGVQETLINYQQFLPTYDFYLFNNNGHLISSSSTTSRVVKLNSLGIISFKTLGKTAKEDSFYILKSEAYVMLKDNISAIASLHAIENNIPLGDLAEREFIQKIDNRYTSLVIIACISSLLLIVAIIFKVLTPISHLTKAVDALSQGNFQQKVEVKGNDEIATLAKSFNLMSSKLLEADNHRRQMTTDLAHELRTPLTIMRCQIDAVEDGLLTLDNDLLTTLSKELYSLQYLVSDLQDLSLLETGNLRLDTQSINVNEIIKSVINHLQIESNFKHINFTNQTNTSLSVVADQQRLTQILNNLLRNALNYSKANSTIILTAELVKNNVYISVIDQGAGISVEQQKSIFNRHYRVKSPEYPASGSGLGLAIAKQLSLAMGGELKVKSEMGKGSVFTISLPAG